MNKSIGGLFFILIAILGPLGFLSCGNSPAGPDPVVTTGSIRVASIPTSASVILDGVDKGMTTDCTLTKVPVGSHSVKLTKAGYADHLAAVSVIAGQTASVQATLTSVPTPQPVNITVEYARVPPIPNPNGLDFPTLTLTYDPNVVVSRGMGKIVDDVFSSSGVPILTETTITLYLSDQKMDTMTSGVQVCRTIRIDGQLLDVGQVLYGRVRFVYGNDNVIRVIGVI
jgi:hypothetical protein